MFTSYATISTLADARRRDLYLAAAQGHRRRAARRRTPSRALHALVAAAASLAITARLGRPGTQQVSLRPTR